MTEAVALESPSAAPTGTGERIHSLDVLRGIALLGILLMNVQSMGMIGAAYFNPTAWGDLEGINRAVWSVCHIFADQKFMFLFSMLFGAGIVLFAEHAQAKGRKPAGLHYRRTFWLIVFGMLHAYFLWYGDILVTYGLCALGVYLFRRLPAWWLVFFAFACFAVGFGVNLLAGLTIPWWDAAQLEQMRDEMWRPTAEVMNAELEAYRGGYAAQMPTRALGSLGMQTGAFVFFLLWRAAGAMFLGMALYKWRVFSAARSNLFYGTLAVVGLGLGLPTIAWGVLQHFEHHWSFEYSFFLGSLYNYAGSIAVGLGYVGLALFLFRTRASWKIWKVLAAVGRMAFTNYICQTILVTWVFYGHGLGLFGDVPRIGQFGIVMAVWAIQLTLSPIWLRNFRFGPLEWCWRSLTYWKRQPFRN